MKSKLERNQNRPNAYFDLTERNRLAEQRRVADEWRAKSRQIENEDQRAYREWVEEQLDSTRHKNCL